MDPSGKVAVVAGGSGNLGSAIVAALQARGARVAVVDIGDAPVAGAELSVQADLADDASAAAAVARIVAVCGGIDILVNAAGLIHSEPLVNLLDRERRAHRIDTWGTRRALQSHRNVRDERARCGTPGREAHQGRHR